MLPPTLSNHLTVTRRCRKQTCWLRSTEGSWAKTLQIFQFSMWNTLYSTRVNRNGDKPTITADSFNAVTFFAVLVSMYHFKCVTQITWRSAQIILQPSAVVTWAGPQNMPGGPQSVHRALTALHSPAWPQEGSWRRGWGWSPMWGKLTWCQAPGLSELHSGCQCAEPSSWAQGCSDATVLKVQQTASITTGRDMLKHRAHVLIKLIVTQLYI